MKRILVSFLALALCAAAFPFLFADAQEGLGRPASSPRPEKTLDQLVRKHERLRLDPAEAARSVRASGRLSLATPKHKFELDLRPNDMRAPDYRAEETGENGVKTMLESGPVRTYKGAVRGQVKAQARFTVDDETVEGMIITPEERYYVEPLRKFDPEAAATDFVLYKKSDVIEDANQMCGTTIDQEISEAVKGVSPKIAGAMTAQAAAAGMIYEAEIATEADYEYVTALGGSTAANAAITSIMNQVDGVYEAEVGLSFKLVYQHTWAAKGTGYPYTTTAVGPDVLQQFTNHWNTGFSNIRRDLAHMWTGKNLVDPNNDPNLIGIAWIGAVCAVPELAYGVSQHLTTAAQRSILAAHEIGHNFGAAHSCTGTIMNSYLAGTRLTFCSFSRDQITKYMDLSPSCLSQVCRPTISPAGQTILGAGGVGSLSVMAGATCDWTAKSNVSWIVVNSGASGTGSKTVTYTVALNLAATPRTGTLTVAGKTYTVTQAGAVMIKALTLNPANIAGGKKITGTVGLTGPAPATGAVVALSDNLAATTLPASVTIPAGKTSAPFSITTVITTTVQTGNVTASYNGSVVTVPLTVRPPILASFKLSTATVVEGGNVTATLTLDGAAPPTGVVITLSDTFAAAVTPASFTIPSGYATKSFAIATRPVSATETGVVTAKYAGVTINAPLSIRPVGVSSLVLTPAAIVGGVNAQGLVTLEGVAPKDVTVTLTENLASGSVPATIVVPKGAKTQSFTMTTAAVIARQGGVMTAAAQGVSKSLAVSIEKPSLQCSNVTFGAAKLLGVGHTPSSFVTADFNHDGKLDIVVSTLYSVRMYLGSGGGNFVPGYAYSMNSGGADVVVGDFNQDGHHDLAVPMRGNTIGIMLGDGTGNISSLKYVSVGYAATDSSISVVVGDFNGDGKQDLVSANRGDWNISLLPGDGLGGFGKAVNYKLTYFEAGDLVASDFNGDRKLDLVQSNLTWNTGSLMLGNGAGAFARPLEVDLTHPTTAVEPHQVAAGDFNRDGKLDLAFGQTGSLAIVLGDGKGGFSLPPTIYTGTSFDHELLMADMNGDGIGDLIGSDGISSVAVATGDGAGKFGVPYKGKTPAMPADIMVADFNDDGRLDVATIHASTYLVSILLNTCK